jgi:hypothetical protein
MTLPDTDALARLLKGAADGPWSVSGVRHAGILKIGDDTRLHFVGPDGDSVAGVFFDMKTGRGWEEARLISLAPELAAEVIALREALEGLNGPEWKAMWHGEADQ